MTRRRKRNRARAWRPEDVLAGKVAIGGRALVELIQHTEPTDQAPARAEAAHRSRIQHQLQSLLVRRFADEIDVIAAPGGVVRLVHRASGAHAGRVRVAELDEDARGWVQRQLDAAAAAEGRTAGVPTSSPEPTDENEPLLPEALSGEELLARGHEALAAYEYELAAAAYERALVRTRGATAAAAALLALFVEHLAAYAAAVALWPRLSPEAAGDGRVRTLVALAAAHVGADTRARELVRGLTRDSDLGAAAEVYLALARQSLARNDEPGDAAAAQDLAWAREHAGPSRALLELEDALAARVAQRRAPLEARAQAAYEAGDVDEAEQRAREVLARWPESRAARVVLGRIEAQQRQAQVDALLARADAAMAAQDFALTVGLLREAQALDGAYAERLALGPRIARAEAAARDQATQAHVSEIATLLAQGQDETALVAYLGLDDTQRAEVRRAQETAMLTWLEDLGAPLTGSRAQAAAQAVRALARARAALEQGDGQAAEAELAPHEKLLRQVPAWRAARQDAAAAIAARERAQAQEGLARAAALLDAEEDLALVRALLDGVDPRWLAKPARAERETLHARLTRAERRAAIEARLEHALAGGDLLDAREAAEAGLAQALPEEHAHWKRQRDDLAARVRRAWCIQVFPGDGERGVLDRLGMIPYDLDHSAVLTADGAHALFATSLRRWLFLRVVSTCDGRITACVLLRTPVPLKLDTTVVCDGEVLLIGRRGKVLRLAWGTWDVMAWRNLYDFLNDEIIFKLHVMVGTPFAWLVRSRRRPTMIIDLVRWRLHRTLPAGDTLARRIGTHASTLMLSEGPGHQYRVYQADGTLAPGYRLPERKVGIELVTLHPRAPGLIVVHQVHHAGDPWFQASWFSPAGEELETILISRVNGTLGVFLREDHDQGVVYLALQLSMQVTELVALATDGGLHVQYRVSVPERVAFLRDAAGVHCIALGGRGGELAFEPIGREPPRLEGMFLPRQQLLQADRHVACSGVVPANDLPLLTFRARYRRMHSDQVRTALEAFYATPDMGAHAWADIVATLASGDRIHIADECVRWALKRYRDHAELVLNAADYLVLGERWSELPPLLDEVDTSRLPPRRIRHLYHLLGLAWFKTGNYAQAREVWTEGAAYAQGEEGACDLQPYLEMFMPMDVDGDEGQVTTVVGRVRWRLMQAVRCLARGDASGALATLDCAHVWQVSDTQTMAHLAHAYLQCEVQRPVSVFHKLLALVAFNEPFQPFPDCYFGNRFVFPGSTWRAEGLHTLAERVHAWLEAYEQRVSSRIVEPR